MSQHMRRMVAGRLPWLALLGLTNLTMGATRAAAQAYARDPATVVIEFSERFGEVGEEDHPSLRIHGDGRVVAHHPRYMKRAGDYTTQLSRAEMDDLVQSLIAKGVMEFDPGTVRARKREAIATRRAAAEAGEPGQIRAVSDADVTRIALHLGTQAKTITWAGLRADAVELPEVVPIRNLAAAADELRTILDRPTLLKTN
jgi:hypothetical protein